MLFARILQVLRTCQASEYRAHRDRSIQGQRDLAEGNGNVYDSRMARIRCFLDRFAKSWNSCSRSWVARNVNGIAKPVIIVEADTKTHDSLLCDRLFNHVPYIAFCLGVIRTKGAATSMQLKKIYFTYWYGTHSRDCDWIPVPQVREHSLQALHGPQVPLIRLSRPRLNWVFSRSMW